MPTHAHACTHTHVCSRTHTHGVVVVGGFMILLVGLLFESEIPNLVGVFNINVELWFQSDVASKVVAVLEKQRQLVFISVRGVTRIQAPVWVACCVRSADSRCRCCYWHVDPDIFPKLVGCKEHMLPRCSEAAFAKRFIQKRVRWQRAIFPSNYRAACCICATALPSVAVCTGVPHPPVVVKRSHRSRPVVGEELGRFRPSAVTRHKDLQVPKSTASSSRVVLHRVFKLEHEQVDYLWKFSFSKNKIKEEKEKERKVDI